MVDITLLGGQSVVDPVTERILTRSSRSLALLGFLASRPGSPQSRSAIAGAFWPDSSERQALTNLRRELHQLRQVIQDDDALEVTPSHLCWHHQSRHRVDLATFLHECAAAEATHDDEGVLRHGTAALALYSGDLLPGMDEPWLDDARTRLRGVCVQLCDRVCAAAERTRRLDVATDAMRKRISVDVYDEPAYRKLMELHAAAGDRAGAVRTYHRLTGLLELDLGLPPDPMTTATLARITQPVSGGAPGDHLATRRRPGPARTALVGRADELETLLQAWRTSLAEGAGVVLVHGGAGIGKTRLVSEFETQIRDGGGVVAVSNCIESSGRLSLAPVTEWLRSPPIAAARGRVDRVWLRETERLVPLASGNDDPRSESGTEPSDSAGELWQQQRFFEGVAHTLLAADRPTLLVLDNLQWCDADTLRFVTVLLSIRPEAPVLVAVTTRPDVEDVNAAAASWLTGLRRAGILTEVRLHPFEAAQSVELATLLTGVALDPTDAALLQQATGGFPLFVVEAARATLDGGIEHPLVATAWSQILRKRLQQTTATAQDVAGLAAALGREFSLSLLVEASDLDADAVVMAVDELWRHRIVRDVQDGYDFSHDLLRDTAYSLVGRPRRWLLHRRLAQSLELLNVGHLEAVAAQLAEQYELAGNRERALTFYIQAADATSEVFAHADALTLLDRAIVQLDGLPGGRHRDEREIACRTAATRIMLALHGYTSPGMETNSLRIVELAERLGRPEEQVSAIHTLWASTFVGGRMRDALTLAERAVGLTREGHDRYAQAQVALGATALHMGRHSAALITLEAAHAAVRDDEYMNWRFRARTFSAGWLAHAMCARGLVDRASELADDAVAGARASGHVPSEVVGLAFAAITHQLVGDVEACARTAHEVVALCERHHIGYYSEWGRILGGWCRGESGAPEMRHGIDTLLALDAHLRMPYWLTLLADVTPDPARAQTILEGAVARAVEQGERWWLPELWRRQARYLPDHAAVTLVARAEALASEQDNRAARRCCREDLAILRMEKATRPQ